MYNLRGQKGNVSTKSIEGHYGNKDDDLSNRLAYYFDFYEGVYEQHQGIMRLHYRCIKVLKSS